MSRSIEGRLKRLEAARRCDEEVTLAELVLHSYGDAPDPEFERRAANSTLRKLIAAAAAQTK